jgi:S-methylmethionine-dependent homocysteine/selenocysteine methylase
MGAAAVLFNCSQPEVMAQAVAVARTALAQAPGAAGTAVQLGVYANAFPPVREDHAANAALCDIRADLHPPGYRAFAETWMSCGATIVGGCCGIGPEHIAELASLR